MKQFQQLAGVFAADLAANAVMSNPTHFLLRLDLERARDWIVEDVFRRTQVYSGPEMVQQYLRDPGGLVPVRVPGVKVVGT